MVDSVTTHSIFFFKAVTVTAGLVSVDHASLALVVVERHIFDSRSTLANAL